MTLEERVVFMQPKEDFLRSMDYLGDVRAFYEPLCKQFQLKYIEIAQLERIVLVGKGFLIEIADNRFDGVGVTYWYKENGTVKRYSCDNYFAQFFDEKERQYLIGGDQTLDICIRNGFIVHAFSLRNKWANLLGGDQSWIAKAKESRWFAELPVHEPQDHFMISLLE